MLSVLSEKLKKLAAACPFSLYVVGGAVRDFYAGLKSKNRDIDICAPVSAEEFVEIAEKSGFCVDATYKNTGAVKLGADGQDYEFTCFRTDEYVRGGHVPQNIKYTSDINLDARRRDFKCNAVYFDIKSGAIADPLGGMNDIKRGILSTVAPADKVFGEDGLRLMRLARFAAQTGFTPDLECVSGAKKNAALIRDIKDERIWSELWQILNADGKYGVKGGQYAGVKLLCDIGVTAIILPELEACRGVKQREDFHNYDVLEHSLRAVLYADPAVRLAALLHDTGKAEVYKKTGRFVGHETVGAETAEGVLTRLKAPKKLAAETVKLIGLHMYDLRCDARESKARRFIVDNLPYFEKLLLLKQADFSACKDDMRIAPFVEKYNGIYAKMKEEGVPLTVGGLDIKGSDLAGFVPACEIGITLKKLLNECVIGSVPNNRQKLLEAAKRLRFIK